MENSRYKFRAWDEEAKIMTHDFTNNRAYLGESGELIHWCQHRIMQFTGLLDKNGKKIYEFMEIDNKYRVIYVAPTYVLQDISNGDIVPMYEDQQITGEYSPVEKD